MFQLVGIGDLASLSSAFNLIKDKGEITVLFGHHFSYPYTKAREATITRYENRSGLVYYEAFMGVYSEKECEYRVLPELRFLDSLTNCAANDYWRISSEMYAYRYHIKMIERDFLRFLLLSDGIKINIDFIPSNTEQ